MSESKMPESLEKLSDMELMNHYRISAMLPRVGGLHYVAAILVLASGGYQVMMADPKNPWMSVLIVAVIPYVLLLSIAYVYRNIRTAAARKFFHIYALLMMIAGVFNAGLGTYEYCNVDAVQAGVNPLWLSYGLVGWWAISLLMVALGIMSWRGASDDMLFCSGRSFSASQIAYAWKKRRAGVVVPDAELPKSEKPGSLGKYALVLCWMFVIFTLLEMTPFGIRSDYLAPKVVLEEAYVPDETIRIADRAFKQGDYTNALHYYRICARDNATVESVEELTRKIEALKEQLKQAPKDPRKEQRHAIFQLGKMYHEGLGVKKNIPVAERFYLLAAKGGNPEAQVLIAEMYERGIPDEKYTNKYLIKPDSSKAIFWYGSAAAKNAPKAAEGRDRVLKVLLSKARTGITSADAKEKLTAADAAIELGRIYLAGRGIPADEAKADEMFKLAAGQTGDNGIYAMIQIAELFEKGEKDEAGETLIPTNSSRAYEWYVRAAESGNADAQKALKKFKTAHPNFGK